MATVRSFAFLIVLLGSSTCLWAAERPNVIVILADDQGWGDLSINGNRNLKTPQIDSLARSGAMFDRFFVQPVCSPTRAEFLTGRYHPRGGVWNVSTGGERLNLDERTLADELRGAGYATGCFGKWHNGTQYPYHPRGRGFDEFYGFTSGHWGDYFDPPLDHNGKSVTGKGFLPDDLTDRAIEFIDKSRSRPFFAYLAFNTPHSPMQVPDEYFNRFRAAELKQRGSGAQKEDIEHTRAALAMMENLDANVGRVLKALDERKLADDTIMIYFSDNGPNGARWNGGMKGRKGSTDEGGVRSPLLVRWPKRIQPGTTIKEIAGAIDLAPTILELTGTKRNGTKPFDGRSLAPLLTGKGSNWPDRLLFAHWNGKVSARTQRYRLDADGKLFDMVSDPEQKRDIAKSEPEAATKLAKAVRDYRAEILKDIRNDTRPFPVGYAEFPIAQLPARDGVPSGGVKRSANAPNCSFFTNWTKPDDAIAWKVEVRTAGTYDVELGYTCPKDSVGSTVELSLGERVLSGKVTEPHDPPLRGKENDRVPRVGESYVKDFRPLKLGTIDLPAGTGTLKLRATAIPGPMVMDLRGLTLTLRK
ncbi:MAG: sulfatase-like hydrolase/transferase [Gemmataceae bacterium]|nr:sulfatase-like hydrolase/transferase [Gemmataceae bacterium]